MHCKSLLITTTAITLLCACNKPDPRVDTVIADHAKTRALVELVKANQDKSGTDIKEVVPQLEAKIKAQESRINDLVKEVTANREELAEVRTIASTPKNTDVASAVEGGLKISVLTNSTVRQQICPILAKLGGPKVEARLIAMATSDSEYSVQNAAMDALATVKSKKTGEVCLGLLKDDSDYVRKNAAKHLMTFGTSQMNAEMLAAIKRLQSSSDSDDVYTRSYLFKALAKTAKPSDFDAILAAYKVDPRCKGEAMAALMACAGNRFGEIAKIIAKNTNKDGMDSVSLRKLLPNADMRITKGIIPILASSNWRTRQAAIELIGKLRDPIATKALFARTTGESDSDCKRSLYTVLSMGFPGITFDANTKKAKLAPKAELDRLIAERNKKVKALK